MRYIDLNNDTFRQTVVDKQDDQFLGQVSSVMLNDNKTILAVYPKGHGRGSIVMKVSRDGGVTWETQTLPESFVTSLEVPTIYQAVGADGQKRLLLFSGFYPIRMSVSEDDGKFWSPLTPIGNYAGICAMGDLVPLGVPGHYMALFHDDANADHHATNGTCHSFWRYCQGDKVKYVREVSQYHADGTLATEIQSIFVDGDKTIPNENGVKIYKARFSKMDNGQQLEIKKILTYDGGLTWSEPTSVVKHPSAYLCEPGAIRLQDGNIAVLMRDNSRKHHSFIMFSRDNGETFTHPKELPAVLTGDRHICRRLKDGRIAITFRDYCVESASLGDWVLWIGTDEDLLNGYDGQYKFRLKYNFPNAGHWKCDCGYAGLHILEDDTIFSITYGHWQEHKKPYIMAVRLHLNEFDDQ